MRKCSSCGYLLLGDGEVCARCGGPVVAGRPVRVPAAAAAPAGGATTPTGGTAVPPANSWAAATPPPAWPPAPSGPGSVPAPSVPSAQPTPAVPSYGRLSIPPPVSAPPPGNPSAGAPLVPLRESWEPATVTAPVAKRRPKVWAQLALVVAIVLVAGAAVVHMHSDPLPAGTSGFVAGGGVTYDSPDGSFEVQLPQTPTTDQEAITVNNVTATLFTALSSTSDYEIGAADIAFPSVVPAARVNDMLDAALTKGVDGTHGTLVKKIFTRHGVLPAIEGHFNAPDGYRAEILVVSNGWSLVLLIVHSKTGTDRLFKALEDSLIIR